MKPANKKKSGASEAVPLSMQSREILTSMTATEAKRKQMQLETAMRELSSQIDFAEHPSAPGRGVANWQMDLLPHIIEADDWELLSQGVLQRARALNAYIADIYGEQRILKEKILPITVVFNDPAFHRQFATLQPKTGNACLFGAVDVVPVSDGKWMVMDHHMGTPFGLSYVLQSRRTYAQSLPEVMHAVNPEAVAGYTARLADALRRCVSQKAPHIVLLTHSHRPQGYFEAGFLARHMGISIAQPDDLQVRENRLFLRTVHGLEPVHVLLRHVDSRSVDPVALPGSKLRGIPGLTHVVRSGNLTLVNSLGSGIADNRALHRYLPRIIRYYLGEKPVLDCLPTLNLEDFDQRQIFLEKPESYSLIPIQDHDALWQMCQQSERPTTLTVLQKIVAESPAYFVAREPVKIRSLPTLTGRKTGTGNYFLRLFFILGEQTQLLLPGGLTQGLEIMPKVKGRLALPSRTLKETLVVTCPDRQKAGSKALAPIQVEDSKRPLASRVAESLYWLGRYLERAENTARQFSILENLRWDQLQREEQKIYWPLLKAIASATNPQAFAKFRTPPRDTLLFSTDLMLNANQGASVHSSLAAARFNLGNIRDSVSPECQHGFESLWQTTLRAARHKKIDHTHLIEFANTVVAEIARFNGLAERTMVHDDGFHFFWIGAHLERAAGTVELLKSALPHVLRLDSNPDEASTDLTALLRLFASLDAYRRNYRSRPYVDRVTRLLLQKDNNPSSVSYCLRKISYQTSTLGAASAYASGNGNSLKSILNQLLKTIDELPLSKWLPPAAEQLDAGQAMRHALPESPEKIAAVMTQLGDKIAALHEKIDAVYFSHQTELKPII
jgi:uncharacterized circularly permuted ATP-grasp superfamily protein/uncharacterized alpha-E superfamily protein